MRLLGYVLCAAALVVLSALPALAGRAEAVPEWRHWWDLGWTIVNFLVLAGVIVKVARQPLKDFLRSQREAVSRELAEMEEHKKEAQAERERLQKMTANLEQELEEFERLLSEQAAKERQARLEEARAESKLVLERAELWAEQALVKARRRLAHEMLELATDMAMQKIQASITDQDQARLLEQFNQSIKQAHPA